MSFFGFFGRLFGGSNDNQDYVDLGGSDAVFEALFERTDTGLEFQIEFGEPRLIDRGNMTEDLFVVIPTTTDVGPDPADLEYDLPDGVEDATAEFLDILELFEIEKLADLGDLEDKIVPGTKENGTVAPDFNSIEDSE